jgi:hypothetical protein
MMALLPRDALEGICLGISVSESKDLSRLGLLESHFRLALGEIARCVLIAGGRLAYGGHLQSSGYSVFLIGELERYRRRDRPFLACLSFIEHRRMSLRELKEQALRLGLYGNIVCLDAEGNVIAPDQGRGEEPQSPPTEARAPALTALRRFMIGETHGRVFMGGKQSGFTGAMPGLLEEAIMAVEERQPIYLAGGFGGITHDIARALEIDQGDWFPTLPKAPAMDSRVVDGLARLRFVAKDTEYASVNNGLSAEENRRLAATHRPSEIATLLSVGLGRRFAGEGEGNKSLPNSPRIS